MADNHALLVVDDEEVVCQACRRIFTRQGFQVDTNTDARQGLALAAEKEYEIILLDIKMPNMDGIQFLERLREKRPDVPVLIITGYPSIPNAAAAMRLGACDYVTKPFTSEEITRAVQRVLAARQLPESEEAAQQAESAATTVVEPLFWETSWFRAEADGSACVGAVLPGLRGSMIAEIRLPRIGEVVYQGLPMTGVSLVGKSTLTVAAPISGVVVAVNEHLPSHPQWLANDPCGEGWMAIICSTRYEDEVCHCQRRRVILVNADAASTAQQSSKLAALGCQVEQIAERAGLERTLRDVEGMVLLLDAGSLGADGPNLAKLINARAPLARIVVLAAPGGAWEAEYRKQKIFYYAVEPFADNEIADILSAAFHHQEAPPKAERQKAPSEPINSIAITNRNGHKVQLLAAPGLLWCDDGLGRQINQKLLAQMFPLVITPGEAYLTPANILKMAAGCDRLMVLVARDVGLLPGGLAQDTKPQFDIEPGEAAGKVTMVTVQPDALGGLAGLDPRTTAALAEHLVREMASY